MVGADDRPVANARGKQDFINGGTKFDLCSKEFSHFGAPAVAAVRQFYVGWHKANAGQLPAQADRNGCKTLDLVTIRVTANTNISVSNATVFAADIFQSYSFVDNRGVAGKSLQGIAQELR